MSFTVPESNEAVVITRERSIVVKGEGAKTVVVREPRQSTVIVTRGVPGREGLPGKDGDGALEWASTNW